MKKKIFSNEKLFFFLNIKNNNETNDQCHTVVTRVVIHIICT